jgi:uncharacterized protein YggE
MLALACLNRRVQMIERPWGVSAYGAASVKAAPDLVRIRFNVIRLEPTPSAAFAATQEAVQHVRAALRAHAVPDAAVQRSRLDLETRSLYRDGEQKFLGYQCQAMFVIESAGLDDAQDLLVDLVAAGANEIDAVDFDVNAKGALRAEARRRAVAAARDKAELYAEAAGVRLGAIAHIEDVDPEQARAERYRGHSAGGAASTEDLAPGHVVVSAAVVLGFLLNHQP